MPEDRLRHDRDNVENLEDIIEARDPGTSHLARDVDAFDQDLDIPEDIDVDDALTFPHPKHKKDPNDGVELMDTPRKGDAGVDWAESQTEMLPSDYMDRYDDAISTDAVDDDESEIEEQVDAIGHITAEEVTNGVPMITKLPKGFHAEE